MHATLVAKYWGLQIQLFLTKPTPNLYHPLSSPYFKWGFGLGFGRQNQVSRARISYWITSILWDVIGLRLRYPFVWRELSGPGTHPTPNMIENVSMFFSIVVYALCDRTFWIKTNTVRFRAKEGCRQIQRFCTNNTNVELNLMIRKVNIITNVCLFSVMPH